MFLSCNNPAGKMILLGITVGSERVCIDNFLLLMLCFLSPLLLVFDTFVIDEEHEEEDPDDLAASRMACPTLLRFSFKVISINSPLSTLGSACLTNRPPASSIELIMSCTRRARAVRLVDSNYLGKKLEITARNRRLPT